LSRPLGSRKFIPEAIQTTPGKRQDEMDGDSSAQAMGQGANSAMKNTEMSNGIHGLNHQAVGPGGVFVPKIIL